MNQQVNEEPQAQTSSLPRARINSEFIMEDASPEKAIEAKPTVSCLSPCFHSKVIFRESMS